MLNKWFKKFSAGIVLLSASQSFAGVDFTKDLMPLFEGKCIKCHGLVKESGKPVTKGDLDLTKPESIKEVFKPGNPEKSPLYELVISADEDEFMPPKGDRLTDAEKKLIYDWIKEGGSFEGYSRKAQGESLIDKLAKGTPEPNAAALKHFEELGALVLPLAQKSPLLQVNFKPVGVKSNPEMTGRLLELKENIIWLNLSKANINDASLTSVAQLKKLTRLHLDNTPITDAGLSELASLENLEYLNLYATNVSDTGIAKLASLKNLQKLYLWQSKVTQAGVDALQKQLPNTYIHAFPPVLEVKEESKKEEPKKEEPKKEEPKKEEPKKK